MSWWNLVKKFEFLLPFSKATEKTMFCLVSPGNVLPLHLLFSSSQNSNVDNILSDLNKIPPRPF